MNIKINGLDKLKLYLNDIEKNYETIVKSAVNKKMTAIRDFAVDEIQTELNVTKKDAKTTFHITKISKRNPSGSVASIGRPIAASSSGGLRFGGRALKKGFSFEFKKTKGRKTISKAFKLQFKSGHIGVFLRTKSAKGQKKASAGIKEIYSSRVPDVLSNNPRMKAVLAATDKLIQQSLDAEIDKLVKERIGAIDIRVSEAI